MFLRNIAAFTQALGVQNAPIIMSLSLVAWPTDDDRNQFIKDLTGLDYSTDGSYGI